MKIELRILVAALISGLFIHSAALASDHTNLDTGLPTQVEDAYPIKYLGREAQLAGGYEKSKDNKDLYRIEPRFEYGVLRDTQLSLEVPVLFGPADKKDQANTNLSLLYNFNTEGVSLPAIALMADAEFPTSEGSENIHPGVTFILTKTLPPYSMFHQLHLNIGAHYLPTVMGNGRHYPIKAVGGYSARLRTDLMLVADYVYEEQELKDQTSQVVEAGLRFQYNPLTVLSGGLGTGTTSNSPDFRVILGYQHEVTFF